MIKPITAVGVVFIMAVVVLTGSFVADSAGRVITMTLKLKPWDKERTGQSARVDSTIGTLKQELVVKDSLIREEKKKTNDLQGRYNALAEQYNRDTGALDGAYKAMSRKIWAEEDIMNRAYHGLDVLAGRVEKIQASIRGPDRLTWVIEPIKKIRDMIEREGNSLDTITILPGIKP
jgi:hypothetical protein